VGRRSSSRSIAAIYQAFLQQNTWRQAELADRVGISVKALRDVLGELEELKMPLEHDREHPNVFWSVPRGWFPGGIALTQEDAIDLVQELWSLPATASREALLKKLLGAVAHEDRSALERARSAVLTPTLGADEEAYLQSVHECLMQRAPLRMRYFSAHRGAVTARSVSVQRVVPGPPARFVGWCQEDNKLKWFRVDNIARADLDRLSEFVEVADSDVEAYLAHSADGFHGDEPADEHVFFVREPEARWVQRNLLAPMNAEGAPGGIRVTAKTAGALRIARFVVSLGEAARAESAALRGAVYELARGALNALQGRATRVGGPLVADEGHDLNKDAVGAIRSKG
jgi:predicted DNA-binding transcriptional regulator YafY